ncbi:MAG TPA: MFS transporter [Ktedonobacterales bacterium]|jgi:MFS family permease|nr:MFS transporter [Ktedonobacterales bacterium]
MNLPAFVRMAERPRAPHASATPRWGRAFGVFAVLANIDTDNAIWLIYLAARGYSPFAIGLFEMVFHIAKFVTEVPTGVFADLVGRRASLLASCLFGVVSAALFLAPTPAMIALSFTCSGVSWAFKGGAQEAVVWTLASESAGPDAEAGAIASRYSHLYSRFLVLTLIAAALGAGASGFLLRWNVALPFVIRAVGVALAIGPLLLLPALRPARPEHLSDEISERFHVLAHLRAGLGAALRSPALLGLLLLSALEGTVFTTSNYYTQLYFQGLGYTAAAIGVIFGVGAVLDFLYTGAAPRIIGRVRRRWLIPALIAGVTLGLLLMSGAQPVVGLLGFLLIFRASDALFVPAISTAINARAPEAQRATVLSLETGLFSAGMIALFPLFGLGLSHVSYQQAYFGVGVGLLLASAGIAALVWGLRRWRGRRGHDTIPERM